MSTNKVFRLPSKGAGYTSLQENFEPIPKIKPHEVLLRIHAAALNYRDLLVASGGYYIFFKDNVVPCSDAAGTVVDVGSDAEGLEKGDKAVIIFDITNLYGPQQDSLHALGGPIDGVLRQYMAVPASAAVKIPQSSMLDWPQLWFCPRLRVLAEDWFLRVW